MSMRGEIDERVEDHRMGSVIRVNLAQLVADAPDASPNPHKVGVTITPGATPGAFLYTFIGVDFTVLHQRLTQDEQALLQGLLQKMLPPSEGP